MSHQQLVDRLFALSHQDQMHSAEFVQLDALVYDALLQTYAEDDVLEARISSSSAELPRMAQAA